MLTVLARTHVRIKPDCAEDTKLSHFCSAYHIAEPPSHLGRNSQGALSPSGLNPDSANPGAAMSGWAPRPGLVAAAPGSAEATA